MQRGRQNIGRGRNSDAQVRVISEALRLDLLILTCRTAVVFDTSNTVRVTCRILKRTFAISRIANDKHHILLDMDEPWIWISRIAPERMKETIHIARF